ncbi:hypothetical protein [Nostoc sp. FACHB-110]|uniref:hypothetical protein n=1 Tax=Nostoc sp. FACHB-110 TaxID=2692834 RepID=UPI0016850555|nr:hypothetical protein [Nostoc sp. FACHB-110]MBD2439216.1 hypothetical protein [Nostoc sp. FACHB-110]
MQSQKTQATVLDAQKLQELNEEIHQEISQVLKNSNVQQILEKYGLSLEDSNFHFQYGIESNTNNHSLTIPGKRLLDCRLPNGTIIPC